MHLMCREQTYSKGTELDSLYSKALIGRINGKWKKEDISVWLFSSLLNNMLHGCMAYITSGEPTREEAVYCSQLNTSAAFFSSDFKVLWKVNCSSGILSHALTQAKVHVNQSYTAWWECIILSNVIRLMCQYVDTSTEWHMLTEPWPSITTSS